MGIRGLFTYIQNYVDSALEWHQLHDCRMVIDGNNLAYELYNNGLKLNSAFGGDYDKYAIYVEEFFTKLLECGVEPFIIMDGGHPMQRNKFMTAFSRMKDQTYTCMSVKPENNSFVKIFPILGRSVFVSVTHKLGIRVLQCDFEADDDIVVVAKKLNAYVLSNDSDFYLFNVPFILLNSMNMNRIQKENKIDGTFFRFIPCYKFNPRIFAQITNVEEELMPILAPILGNDCMQTGWMHAFHDHISSLRPSSRTISTRHKLIMSVIRWLGTQKDGPDEVLEKIFEVKANSFDDQRKQLLKKGLYMYFPKRSTLLPWFAPHNPSCPATPEDNRTMNVDLAHHSSEVKLELSCSCTERLLTNLIHGRQLPDWFVRAYRLHLVHPVIPDILNKEYFFSIPQIEVSKLKSIYLHLERVVLNIRRLLWYTLYQCLKMEQPLVQRPIIPPALDDVPLKNNEGFFWANLNSFEQEDDELPREMRSLSLILFSTSLPAGGIENEDKSGSQGAAEEPIEGLANYVQNKVNSDTSDGIGMEVGSRSNSLGKACFEDLESAKHSIGASNDEDLRKANECINANNLEKLVEDEKLLRNECNNEEIKDEETGPKVARLNAVNLNNNESRSNSLMTIEAVDFEKENKHTASDLTHLEYLEIENCSIKSVMTVKKDLEQKCIIEEDFEGKCLINDGEVSAKEDKCYKRDLTIGDLVKEHKTTRNGVNEEVWERKDNGYKSGISSEEESKMESYNEAKKGHLLKCKKENVNIKDFKKTGVIPSTRWYIRKGSDVWGKELRREHVDNLPVKFSLFTVESMTALEKKEAFYKMTGLEIIFNEDVPQNLEFILYCICFWRKTYDKNIVDYTSILASIMCIIMFFVVDPGTGRVRDKKTFEALESHSKSIRAKLKNGTLADPCNLTTRELIESITEEECQLANLSLFQFHEIDHSECKKTYDRLAVHAFSGYQATIYYLQLVNSLLRFPFPNTSVELFWSGTFSYNVRKCFRRSTLPLESILSTIFRSNLRITHLFLKIYHLVQTELNLPPFVSSGNIPEAHENKVLHRRMRKLNLRNPAAMGNRKKKNRGALIKDEGAAADEWEKPEKLTDEEMAIMASNMYSLFLKS